MKTCSRISTAGPRFASLKEVVVPRGYTHKIVGLLNDDLTPWGFILGLSTCWVTTPEVRKRTGRYYESGFKTRDELNAMAERLETWSQDLPGTARRPAGPGADYFRQPARFRFSVIGWPLARR